MTTTPTLSMVAPGSSPFLGAAFKSAGVHGTGRVVGEASASTSAEGGHESPRTGALTP